MQPNPELASKIVQSILQGIEKKELVFQSIQEKRVADRSVFDLEPLLMAHSGLVSHLPETPSRWGGALIRWVRKRIRNLIAPWLDYQTRFNQLTTQRNQQAISKLVSQIEEQEKLLRQIHSGLQDLFRVLGNDSEKRG
jgi:hypothetical protein